MGYIRYNTKTNQFNWISLTNQRDLCASDFLTLAAGNDIFVRVSDYREDIDEINKELKDIGLDGITSFNGNIGIINHNPQFDLDVNGDINFTGRILRDGTEIQFGNLWSQSGNNVFRSEGRVGIGNNNPTTELDVNGTIKGISLVGDGIGITNVNAARLAGLTSHVSTPSTIVARDSHGSVNYYTINIRDLGSNLNSCINANINYINETPTTLFNSPEENFIGNVVYYGNNNNGFQLASNSQGSLYIRHYLNNSFGNWKQLLTDLDNTNWDLAYDRSINEVRVTGNETKTLTLIRENSPNLTTSWTDNSASANDYLNDGNFNDNTGDLTLNVLNQDDVVINLDGRYLPNSTSLYQGFSLWVDNTNRGNIASEEVINLIGGTNVSLAYDTTNNSITINSSFENTTYSQGSGISIENEVISHADTSSQPSSNNQNGIAIQSIGLDTYGHITSISAINFDNRYLRSFTETDPTVPSHVKAITSTNITNWNNTYNDTITDIAVTGNITKTITLTRQDGDTITSTFDDHHVNAASFDDSTGIITLNRTGELGNLTIPLDGRYLRSYSETSTLQDVISRGSSTDTTINIVKNNITGKATLVDLFIASSDSTMQLASTNHGDYGSVFIMSDHDNTTGVLNNAWILNRLTSGSNNKLEFRFGTSLTTASNPVLYSFNTNGQAEFQTLLLSNAPTGDNHAVRKSYIDSNFINNNQKGIANGVVPLDADGLIATSYLRPVTNNFQIVDDIAARDAIDPKFVGLRVYVIDASADPNISSGAAEYLYRSGNTWLQVSGGDVTISWSSVTDKPTTISGFGITDENYVNTIDFDTTTGVLTLGRSREDDLTADLDGRYMPSGTDLYSNWLLRVDNTQRGTINSGNSVNFVGGNNVSLTYSSSNNTITINSNFTNTLYTAGNGLELNGTEFSHEDTSEQSSSTNTNGVGIQSISVDGYGHITNIATIDYDNRYLRSFTETDPTVPSHVKGISTGNISNWNTAYNRSVASINFSGTTNKILTLTKQDGSVLTASFTDTDFNNHVDSVDFNTSNGVLTLGRTGSLSDLTTDLDGRYMLASTALYSSWRLFANNEFKSNITNNTPVNFLAGNNITLGYSSTNNTITINALVQDTTYSAGSGIIFNGTQINHADTSSQASSTNGNGVVIQSISLDTFGHITSIGTNNLDTRYLRSESDTLDTVLGRGNTSSIAMNLNSNLTIGNSTDYRELRVIRNVGNPSKSYKLFFAVNGSGIGTIGIHNTTDNLRKLLTLSTAGSLSWDGNTIWDHGNDSNLFKKLSTITTSNDSLSDTNIDTRVTDNGFRSIIRGSSSNALLTFNIGGNTNIFQIQANSSENYYLRNRTNTDTWKNWRRIWHSGDFTSNDVSLWNVAYADSIISANITGTSTKVLTLNKRSGNPITATWVDHSVDTDTWQSVVDRGNTVTLSNNTVITLGSDSLKINPPVSGGNTHETMLDGNIIRMSLTSSDGFGQLQISNNESQAYLGFNDGEGNSSTFSIQTDNLYFDTNKIWHEGNDGAGSELDADLLDGQEGSYYRDYNNLINKPSIQEPGNATITISGGSGIDVNESFTTNQNSNETIVIRHGDTSTQSSVSNSANTAIRSISLDSYGHITSISSMNLDLRYVQISDLLSTYNLNRILGIGNETVRNMKYRPPSANSHVPFIDILGTASDTTDPVTTRSLSTVQTVSGTFNRTNPNTIWEHISRSVLKYNYGEGRSTNNRDTIRFYCRDNTTNGKIGIGNSEIESGGGDFIFKNLTNNHSFNITITGSNNNLITAGLANSMLNFNNILHPRGLYVSRDYNNVLERDNNNPIGFQPVLTLNKTNSADIIRMNYRPSSTSSYVDIMSVGSYGITSGRGINCNYEETGGDATWRRGIIIQNYHATPAEVALAFRNRSCGANYWITGLNQDNYYSFHYGTYMGDDNRMWRVDTSGNTLQSGNALANEFTLSSDRRLKHNIKPLKSITKDIKFVEFNYKHDKNNRKRVGVIAQDLEKVAPEMVYTDTKGMKTVAYIPLLIDKISYLENEIKKLKKLIK